MKKLVRTISAVVLAGSLVGSARAADGFLLRQQAGGDYCHMEFPAIRPRTLATNQPQLKSPSTGDVIDYYGSCEESPTGRDQVIEQRRQEEFGFDRDYEE